MVRWFYALTPILYPLAALAAFALTVRADPFALFDRVYTFLALYLAPGLLVLFAIGLA